MKAKALLSLLLSFIVIFSGLSPAYANTSFIPEMKTTNGSAHVGMSRNGTAAWSTDGVTWNTVNSGLSKNGVRSLIYSKKDNMFIATSFFTYATSVDGKTWNQGFLPAGEKFNPADIISDAEFFGKTSMTVNDIQSFISSKVNKCVTGYTCLDTFTEQTWSRDATLLCDAYTSEGVETAAQIIWKVSQACNIKAEVLLVTLQKENSLVTSTAPSSARYKTAMGYACPDTAACDSQYFGFYNQVYNAAKQFKRYANPPGTSLYFTWYPVGKTSNIRWSPDATCGTSPVTIANQATAGLYYYTPYQPNAAALKNINGLGDDCSAYGNRNFWKLYNLWFNTDVNYSTFIATNGSNYIVMDDEGTVSTSLNGKDWSLNNPLTPNGSINLLEYDSYNKKYHATTVNNKHYYSADGIAWESRDAALPSAPAETPVTQPTPAPTPTPTMPAQPPATTTPQPTTPPTTTPQPNPTPQPSIGYTLTPKYYTIVKGDTLTKLAAKYKTTVSELARWNKIKTTSTIYVGQKLIIGYTKTPTVKYHTVVKGDTMWGISQKYKVSVYSLTLLNPQITNPAKIYVGQKIRYQ